MDLHDGAGHRREIIFRKRKWAYFGCVALAVLLASFISGLAFYLHVHQPELHYYQVSLRRIVPNVFFVLASISIGALAEKDRLEKERKEKETEHLRTELSFLRGQVNPHFMLNVLNSMVLLARKQSHLLEPVLLELAGLMNYMLYEMDNEKIRLEDEIEYLRVYIDLQMLRFRDDVVVHFNGPECVGEQFIEPMLLIPIVENAFKHGIGLVNAPFIDINIIAMGKDTLSVTVTNKYNPLLREEEKKTPGIGLINLRKRLDLIYPGKYYMEMTQNSHTDAGITENRYIMRLNIPLQ